jgi:putative ABC transport system permease protein
MFRHSSLMVTNTFRNRRRSVLTISSIAVSLCLLGMLMAMYRALFLNTEASPAQALRLITHHRVSITQPMPVSFESKIKQVPGVRDVMVWQWYGGTYKDARDQRNFFARFAVEPDKLFNIRSEVDLPKDEQLAFQRTRTACIVGKGLAEKFDWKLGERVTLLGDIFPVNLELTIAGIYRAPDDEQTLYFNYDYLRELLKAAGRGAEQVGVFQIKANSTDDVERVAAAVDKEFENSTAPTKTESERAWQLSFIAFVGNLKLFLLSICAAITFTILLVSANTISMSVRERVREIGILKTLGFTRETVLWIILGESTLIAVGGGVVGIILAEGVCYAVRHNASRFASLNLGMTPDVAFGVILAAAVIGLASSFIPAWNASRLSILDSLRHSG